MASKIGLSYRREGILSRFRHETNRLQVRGVDVGSFPERGRDAEVIATDQLEYATRLLAAAADRIDELGDQFKGLTLTVEGAAPAGYEALTVPMLREEIARRGLEAPAKAKKTDLVAILTEHDQVAELDEDEPA